MAEGRSAIPRRVGAVHKARIVRTVHGFDEPLAVRAGIGVEPQADERHISLHLEAVTASDRRGRGFHLATLAQKGHGPLLRLRLLAAITVNRVVRRAAPQGVRRAPRRDDELPASADLIGKSRPGHGLAHETVPLIPAEESSPLPVLRALLHQNRIAHRDHRGIDGVMSVVVAVLLTSGPEVESPLPAENRGGPTGNGEDVLLFRIGKCNRGLDPVLDRARQISRVVEVSVDETALSGIIEVDLGQFPRLPPTDGFAHSLDAIAKRDPTGIGLVGTGDPLERGLAGFVLVGLRQTQDLVRLRIVA